MRRRLGLVVIVAILLAAFFRWRMGETGSSAPAATPPSNSAIADPQLPADPQAARPVAAPAIQLTKAVQVRPARALAPGAFEGSVVDADTGQGIGSAELTFSHDDGAYSTSTGAGGAFRF